MSFAALIDFRLIEHFGHVEIIGASCFAFVGFDTWFSKQRCSDSFDCSCTGSVAWLGVIYHIAWGRCDFQDYHPSRASCRSRYLPYQHPCPSHSFNPDWTRVIAHSLWHSGFAVAHFWAWSNSIISSFPYPKDVDQTHCLFGWRYHDSIAIFGFILGHNICSGHFASWSLLSPSKNSVAQSSDSKLLSWVSTFANGVATLVLEMEQVSAASDLVYG